MDVISADHDHESNPLSYLCTKLQKTNKRKKTENLLSRIYKVSPDKEHCHCLKEKRLEEGK